MTDLDIIKQLEQEIDKKLEQIDLDKVTSYSGENGYAVDKNNNVVGLSLDYLELSVIPNSLIYLINLKKLSLVGNDFNILSNSFTQLQNLMELRLYNNQLQELPTSFGQLQNLRELYLENNQLQELPTSFGQLQNLRWLELHNNQLKELPASFGQLQNLSYLDLSYNQLKELPASFGKFQNMYHIALFNNPLKTPPYEIATQGIESIRNYFNALGDNPQPMNELKMLLVGEGASGKTSLVKQLLGENFNEHESQTHGILIRHWQFDTATLPIKARLWDFGGQEIMHATHQFFLSKRSLYLLVLDGRKEEKTEYWLQHIESFGGQSPVLIILNKMDENPGFDVNRTFLQQKYPFIVGFYRISCKTTRGIDELKQAIQQAIAKVEILETLWPESWLKVKQALEQKNVEGEKYIPYDDYVKLCETNDIKQESFQQTLVKFLHDLGIVIHFKQALLEETNVINPKWVTEAVYKIINSENLANNKGILEHAEFCQYLSSCVPSHKQNYILELMRKFELCYQIEHTKQILIPDLLPVEQPAFEFDKTDAIQFLLSYEFLPKTIIAKFIVKMHRDIKQELRWRTGAVLEDKQFNATAVIVADEEKRQISIQINGQQKREYFAAILYTFRDIRKIFEELSVQELICLPDNPEETVSYKKLIKLEQRGKTEYAGEERDYSLAELLGTVRTEDPMQQVLSIVRKLSEQMLTKDEFLQKSDDILKMIAETSDSEQELQEKISRIFMVQPNIMGIGINFDELYEAASRWFKTR
ncbi:COR domain-containing protein [Candidatus Albibeggiatoa sp. nov. BB20]|uniref:COR domain-containing protein n=1 Tax=Candidatus Albibeggiatoa sp. nov. BB20 TaxID=3162723 RepID=UPI0033657FAD